ncbi:DUF2802 domain-containing protein [Methylomonas sp. LL1]|uniref:DUF2802 domain-containing protein n=1 Tax=Methylomonas sp. LL1 TaxID=2785785 RepID=UPI0018C393A8|nr:DUF2802 domain-containing protein [Methylomonas sp. LL1]QPK62117.1 DUF2802 domain-containing protein [Methylomonas sp. LL1]CAG1020926.1 hypothetical protein MTYM_00636 [Methylococcales bacterium]
MNDLLLPGIAGVLALASTLLAIGLIRLWREQKKLIRDVRTLASQLQRGNDDIAGLCSAAVAVDKRLAANESRLSNLLDSISFQPQSSSQARYEEAVQHDEEQDQDHDHHDQGYQLAIEKIRRGANVEELVKSCGLTRDEAVLLVRLHGR